MNILVVCDFYPWPENSGGRIRIGGVVRALSSLGSVDVFAIATQEREASTPSDVSRFDIGERPVSRFSGVRRLSWLLAGRLPASIATRDYAALRSRFLRWARPRYDLAWFRGVESFVALGDSVGAPVIVDLDDLEDWKLRSRLRNVPHRSVGTGSTLRTRIDVRRWRSVQRRIAASVTAVTVCSDLDRLRLGVDNGVVIPNGYEAPARPVGRLDVGEPPVIVFPGSFAYLPNIDGARFLTEDVLPRMHGLVADARVRLVGRHDGGLDDVAGLPGVDLAGEVRDVTTELARADLVAVPLRFGSGTRIKILEAFAHRIPVVSTSLGCEGLDAIDGQHLLIADDSDSFAGACVRLLTDRQLRRSVTAAALELYEHEYRWDLIASLVVDLARRVAASPSAERVVAEGGSLGRGSGRNISRGYDSGAS